MRKVAVIIPAYNEAQRISAVLQAVTRSSLVQEVIVVSDGSSDETAAVAGKVDGVKVIDLKHNVGKGGAMAVGVRSTDAPIVAFLDADLTGLRTEHVDSMIRPVVSGECEICMGVFRGGRAGSDAAMTFSSFLTGQRAMKREFFEAVPFIDELRMGVEVALNNVAKRRKAKVRRVIFRGVSNCYKEQKLGLTKGLAARTKMYKEIAEAMVKQRKRRRPSRYKWLR